MRKRKRDEYDYKTFGEKVYDFAFKHRIKIILISFIYSLIIYIISWITSNEFGLTLTYVYPMSLISFIIELHFDLTSARYSRFGFSVVMMIFVTFGFILGFFV